MKILVTGAGGFIGSEIVRVLKDSGDDVLPVYSPRNSGRKDEYAVDISDKNSVFEILKSIGKVDAVIHSAGLAHQFGSTPDDEFYRINVEGTRNVCNLAAEVGARRFVLISSVAVYGAVDRTRGAAVDETAKCLPQSAYAKSKLRSEAVAKEMCSDNNISLSIIRPATVIGEGDRGNVFRLIRAIDRRRFFWIGKGANRKSLIHRTDVADACAAICRQSEELIEVLNCSAESVEMKELVKAIEDALGTRVFPIQAPANFAVALGKIGQMFGLNSIDETVQKWLADDIYSADLLKQKYGFVPKIPVLDAIRREVEYYKK